MYNVDTKALDTFAWNIMLIKLVLKIKKQAFFYFRILTEATISE